MLNYLILIAKVYLWGCRRNQTLPGITAFSSKGNYEAEKSICVKTNKMDNGLGGGVASLQTSFGVRLSRIHFFVCHAFISNVCGEAGGGDVSGFQPIDLDD